MIKLHKKLRDRIGPVILQLILAGTVIYNLISFSSINQADPWRLQRLPSNELVDLVDSSLAPFKTIWIYPLIDIYCQGRTLLIPEGFLDSLNLSAELLQSQGLLADVRPIKSGGELTEGEVELILGMDQIDIRTKEGETYHFIMEEKDPSAPLLLLRYENQLFFIPKDLQPESGSGL